MNDTRTAPTRGFRAAAATVLLLAGSALAAPDVVRIATNQGQLVIETDDPDVEVMVKQGGKQVTIVDPKTQRDVTIQAGTSQFEWVQGKDGLRLSSRQVIMERDGREIVRVRLEPAVTTRPPVADPAGEIRRFEGHQWHVLSVAFSPDGKRVASTGYDMTPKVWDPASGKQLLNLTGHAGGAVDDVAFSPDGKLLASAGAGDSVVKVWDVTSGKEVFSLGGHTTSVYGVAFSPDGKYLASGSGDQTVKVWDVASGKEVRTLKAPGMGLVYRVAYSPDGKLLASSGQTVKVWNAVSGEEIRSFAGALLVAFSPDGKRLATAGWEEVRGPNPQSSTIGRVTVWDLATGQQILTFQGQEKIWGLAYCPDGKRLATAGDLTVKIWDAASGKEEFTLKGHTDTVRCVVFSPDGRQVLSGSNDLTVRLWGLLPAGKDPKANLTEPASQNPEVKEPKSKDEADGWVPLFNGKDLAGWSVEGGDPEAWQVERGELLVDSHSLPASEQGIHGIHGATRPRRYNFLLTEKTYSHFLLRFEYQVSQGANSGVALWATPNEKVYREGPIHLEIKLLDDSSYPKIGWPTGTLFWNLDGGGHLLRPDRAAKLKPVGSWNVVEVEARAQSLRVSVNGLEVLNARPDKLAEEAGAFAGLKRCSGHLGFEKNAGVARFRNIAIKELP